jgi:hypothetical protein
MLSSLPTNCPSAQARALGRSLDWPITYSLERSDLLEKRTLPGNVIRILGSVIECIRPGCDENEIASTGYSLRKTEFCRLWLATLLSGTFVLAEDVTGTWLMYNLGGSAFLLSLTASAASAPPFLSLYAACWGRCGHRQPAHSNSSCRALAAAWSALLAFGTWTGGRDQTQRCARLGLCVGDWIAFGAPAWEPSFQTSSPVRIGTSSEF